MTMQQAQAAFEVKNLSVTLGAGRFANTVLHQLDVSIAAGRWTCVVGPNGAGKSTFLRTLAGLSPVQHGQVVIHGKDLKGFSGRERAKTVAWLAQGGADQAADDLTVHDIVMLGRFPHMPWLSAPGPADHVAVKQAMEQTRVWPWRARLLGSLSGGERQRVLLARLLAVQADIVLMDEPLANLDPPHQADCIALVRALVSQGKTVVTVLHEISLALLADDLLVMQSGKLQHAGPSHEPAAHMALQAVFEHRLSIHQVNNRWLVLPT
ncbi:MAG TPA: ABC transporter ATP-binding protein [Limnobacter sp.]|nr:ABC transporter ATP-binding protein [Limnobacter sp.]